MGIDMPKSFLETGNAHVSKKRQDGFEPELTQNCDEGGAPKDDIFVFAELQHWPVSLSRVCLESYRSSRA